MKIVWDEPKRLATLDGRGLDFADLTLEFFLGATVLPAKKGRSLALGLLGDRALAVVFVPYGTEAVSVVSMRPASRKERKLI